MSEDNQSNITVSKLDPNLRMTIRAIVRSSYDLQAMRIQLGNRIVATFRTKMGITNTPNVLNNEEDKQAKALMTTIRTSYNRVVDGIIDISSDKPKRKRDILSAKKIVYNDTISNYAELALVDQYLSLLKQEESQFNVLEKVLQDVPIYKHFLSTVPGLGKQLSGIIVSEIDIHRAEYPSSLHAYAGLDTVTVGYYINDDGKEVIIPPRDLHEFYSSINDPEAVMEVNGKRVLFRSEGRSKRIQSLVEREYVAKDGTIKTKNSISFNPFLKSKLVSVMSGSFLKQSRTLVNGIPMGVDQRRKYAKGLGMVEGTSDISKVDAYLLSIGKSIEFKPVGYAEVYYNYKHRLQNMPAHSSKTPQHLHNMSLRYMTKQFLIDLYREWRALEDLPVAPSYAEAKLGLTHGVATEEKVKFYNNRS